MLVNQVKSNLIRQREKNLLIPAAGPGASDVLHLLRPAAAPKVQPVSSTIPSPFQLPAEIEAIAPSSTPAVSASFRAKTTLGERQSTEMLQGISCAIGAGGKVCSLQTFSEERNGKLTTF